MELTEWIISEIRILEPMTALTDLIVTAVCIFGFIKLNKLSKQNNNYLKSFPYFILLMGLGTFFAAFLTHAFSYVFNTELISKEEIAKLNWTDKFSLNIHNLPNWLFNIASVTFFEIAMVTRAEYYLENLNKKIYFWIIGIENIAILAAMAFIMKYDIAIAHIGFALFVISLPLQIQIYRKYKAKDAKYIIIGTLIMIIVPPVMVTKFCFSKWFNFNDISHMVIATTMFSFYIAGLYMYNKPNVEKLQNS